LWCKESDNFIIIENVTTLSIKGKKWFYLLLFFNLFHGFKDTGFSGLLVIMSELILSERLET